MPPAGAGPADADRAGAGAHRPPDRRRGRRGRRRPCRRRPPRSDCGRASAPASNRSAGGRPRRPSRIGDSHRSCSSGRQRCGERFGHRTRTEHGAAVRSDRRDRASLQQVEVTVGGHGPLDVLRSHRTCGRPGGRARRAAAGGDAVGVPRRAPNAPRGPVRAGRARRSSHRQRPETNASGPPSTAATRKRSRRPDTGSAPNSTPPHWASIIGCTSTAIVASTRPASRAAAAEPTTASTATRKLLLVADVQHGLEHARHRRLTAVLAGRRRAHHDPGRAVTGQATPGVGGRFGVGPGSSWWSTRRQAAPEGRRSGRAARLAALAPTSAGSTARGSSSATTDGSADMTHTIAVPRLRLADTRADVLLQHGRGAAKAGRPPPSVTSVRRLAKELRHVRAGRRGRGRATRLERGVVALAELRPDRAVRCARRRAGRRPRAAWRHCRGAARRATSSIAASSASSPAAAADASPSIADAITSFVGSVAAIANASW